MEEFNKCYVLATKKEKSWIGASYPKNQLSFLMSDSLPLIKTSRSVTATILKPGVRYKVVHHCHWLIDNDYEIKLKTIYQSIDKAEEIFRKYQTQDIDEDSACYNLVSFKRASNFLIKYSKAILTKLNIIIDSPNILPGPDNSIDLLWKKNHFELLLNIPQEENSLATFFGDNNKGEQIKGTINIDSNDVNNGLILFLYNSI